MAHHLSRHIYPSRARFSYVSGLPIELLRSRPLAVEKNADITYTFKTQYARRGIPSLVMSNDSPFGAADFKRSPTN